MENKVKPAGVINITRADDINIHAVSPELIIILYLSY